MTIGIWILGDQLSLKNTALQSCLNEKSTTSIIFIESIDHVKTRPYHKQKLAFIWSAMCHFAEELKQDNWQVDYQISDSFIEPLTKWIKQNQVSELRVMTPNDRPFLKLINSLNLPCDLKCYPNINFLWQPEQFQTWAKSRKRLILEDFYREGRKRWNILLTDNQKPEGGKWNLDKQNRKPPKRNLSVPKPLFFEIDEITQKVIDKVSKLSDLKIQTYGKIDRFLWGVTRKDALQVLDHFIQTRIDNFGTYQDAMVTGEEYMWHSLISPYINVGLLQPLEVIKKVEQAYYDRDLPLNSVEGFVRQVLGWREYMYGIYHYVDEDYFDSNWFDHHSPLPEFFWNSDKADMNCLHQVLKQTENTGYAHHIQRLMILSNYGLVAGISPQQLENWFHSAYIDAYDWVMQTNVLGMGQFADGGLLASKPYASYGNYIKKMSDYCGNCKYNHKTRSEGDSCPFNYLYWDFLIRHEEKLRTQGRMNLVLSHLKKMSSEESQKIQALANKWKEK